MKLMIKSVMRRKGSFCLTTLVCCIALLMLGFSVYIYENSYYCKKTMEYMLNSRSDLSGYIIVSNEDSYDKIVMLRETLAKKQEIKAVGNIEMYDGLDDGTLARLQQKLEKKDEARLNYVGIDSSAIEFNHIELSSGEIDSHMNFNEYENYVYLGEAYKKYYEIGDKISDKLTPDITINYTVKGFLEKSNRIIDSNIFLFSTPFLYDKCYYSLTETSVIIEWNATPLSNTMFFSWQENMSAEEAQKIVSDVAKEIGVSVSTAVLKDVIEEKMSANEDINKYITNILWIVIVTMVVMLVCIQLSVLFDNMPEYGILYANGYSVFELAKMLLTENIIKIICAGMLALFIMKKLLYYEFYSIDDQIEVVNDIFNHYVIPAIGKTSTIVIILTSIIPIIVLVRQKPVLLIGGNDT